MLGKTLKRNATGARDPKHVAIRKAMLITEWEVDMDPGARHRTHSFLETMLVTVCKAGLRYWMGNAGK